MINENLDKMKIVMRNKYCAVYLPNHPRAFSDGMVYLHILVAENMLGRHLRPDEVVHHKDFNKTRNTEDNLMVFDSNSSHVTFHDLLRNNFSCDFVIYKLNGVYHCESSAELILGKIITDDISKTKRTSVRKICPNCGKLMTSKAKQCIACSRMSSRKVQRPSKHELERELKRDPNFVKLGEKYGVSDNAVRKWCKAYGLPYKTSEFKI